MKHSYFVISKCLIICLIIASCETKSKERQPEMTTEQLEEVYANFNAFVYHTYPEYATYNGIHDYNDRLTDHSIEAEDAFIDSLKRIKNKISSLNESNFEAKDALNLSLFKYTLDRSIEESNYDLPKYTPLSQQRGLHIDLPQMLNFQPLETPKDVDDFFSRLRQYKSEMYKVIHRMHDGVHAEIVLPKRIAEKILDQVNGMLATDVTDFPLYTQAIEKPIMSNRKVELEDIISKEIYPAYQELQTFLVDEYLPATSEEIGVGNVPGGDKYYEYLARQFTTTDLTPEQIFKIGQDEVKRIRTEMIDLLKTMDPNISLEDYFTQLKTDPNNFYTDKEDLLEDYRTILRAMDEKLPELFGKLPKAPYDLKEMEEFRAVSAPAAYYYPMPEDNSRPGYFYVNTYDLPSRPKHTMTALALHEAVPGHHLQIALAKEMESTPWFRKNMNVTAFVEGWGLYAEHLGYETNMYEDPLQHFGALTFEMWRACRLVVDVGMHYMHWTYDEASDFLKSNAALSDLDVQSELERYIAMPGQALAYKIGELKILELRQMAEEKLGDQFDIRAFHDELLQDGSLPLQVLSDKMSDWLKEQ